MPALVEMPAPVTKTQCSAAKMSSASFATALRGSSDSLACEAARVRLRGSRDELAILSASTARFKFACYVGERHTRHTTPELGTHGMLQVSVLSDEVMVY